MSAYDIRIVDSNVLRVVSRGYMCSCIPMCISCGARTRWCSDLGRDNTCHAYDAFAEGETLAATNVGLTI